MKKKKLGYIGWILVVLFLPLILVGGIIYGMVYGYKSGKFDKMTAKTNELIDKLYNKAFKKELLKPILSPKTFTIITTISIFLVISAFGSTEESVDTVTPNSQVASVQSNSNETTNIEKEDNKEYAKETIETDVANNQVASEQSSSNETTNTEKEDNKEDVEETVETENVIESIDTEIHFINTGNSDAILIKQGDKSALIDGGDNDDEGKVVSYLKQEGVIKLEYIFATHPHADHIGGLDAVVDAIAVKNVYVSNGDADTITYSDFINSMANKGLNPSVPLLNSEFKLGTSTFKVLSVANESEPNNNSLVLLYTNGEDKVLLMGDAESSIENRINVGNIDLLKVGHHGSHSSSSSSFIDKVDPEYAVITVGENNKYGHPHKETMDTLENRDIEVHRNDECGHIVFKSSGNGLSVDCKIGSYDAGESEEKEESNTSSNGSVDEGDVAVEPTPAPELKMVWLSATGEKAHSIPNCGRMNPNTARNVPDTGYDYCSKCW